MKWIFGLVLLTCSSGYASPCDSSYPDFCITPPPPDLDCSDIPYKSFRVLQPDPHHFDLDFDGIGCEPYYGPY